jgi:hypothetical protein
VPDRETTLQRYAEIWNGRAEVDELDSLVTPTYISHIGSRDRDVTRLKEDITAYRKQARDISFEVMHRFSEDDYVATRVVAHAADPDTGVPMSACGLNISRWEDGLLAEEWAVWEPLSPSP